MSVKHSVRRTDTGIDWIGAIPCGWALQPLKHLADFINGMAFKPSDWTHAGTPIIRIANLNGSRDFNYYAGGVPNRYHVGRGDLLFGWSGNRGTSFGPFVWQHEGDYFLNQHIFKVKEKDCSRTWLYWCLKAVTGYVEQEAHGIIGMVHVTKGKLGGVNVPVPSEFEQVAVANFLDRETAKIDALIATQTEFLIRLDEHRRALITNVITHGLDPATSSEMTGVTTFPAVPKHWALRPLMHLVAPTRPINYGVLMPGPRVVDGIPLIEAGDIMAGPIQPPRLRRTTIEIEAPFARSRLNPGDVVIAIRGSIGAAQVVPETLTDANVTRDAARISPRSGVNSQYLAYVLGSDALRDHYASQSFGAAVQGINISDLKRAPIPLPPPEEQSRIADYLNGHVEQVERIQAVGRKMIERLRERRAALITAAVTGQIDVTEPALTEAAA